MKTLVQVAIPLAAAVVMTLAAADAAEKPQVPVKREIIPGSELMTPQERERYRQRIRGAKGSADEQRVREEHVKQMRERARLRGLRLPDTPAGQSGAR